MRYHITSIYGQLDGLTDQQRKDLAGAIQAIPQNERACWPGDGGHDEGCTLECHATVAHQAVQDIADQAHLSWTFADADWDKVLRHILEQVVDDRPRWRVCASRGQEGLVDEAALGEERQYRYSYRCDAEDRAEEMQEDQADYGLSGITYTAEAV